MTQVVSKLKSIWDWPLRSQFAETADQRRSLKRSAEVGAAVGSIAAAVSAFSLQMRGDHTLALSVALVVSGYYAGSFSWKKMHDPQRSM